MTDETVTAPEADAAPAPEASTEEVIAEETAAQQTEAETSSDVDSEPTPEPAKKPSQEQRKIAELSYHNREQRRQIDRLVRTIEEQRKTQPAATQETAPKIEDFDTIEDFVNKQVEYVIKNQTQPVETETEIQSDPQAESRQDLYAGGMEKYVDFVDVIGAEDLRITQEMADAIFELDDPDMQVDVAYYLGNNKKVARDIAKLSPVRQIREIVKLEAQLSSGTTQQIKPSKAPAPIKPVGGAKTTETEIQDQEDFESFLKKRNKELGRV